MEQIVKKGDRISVNYTGTLDDGTVFDTSLQPGRTPLEFIVGAGQMIRGFDAGVVGMAVGETKKIHLAPAEAYGEKDPENFIPVAKDHLPAGYTPTLGDKLQMGHGGHFHVVTVSEIKENGDVVLDANHELAGKALNFEVTLVKIY